VERGSAVGAAGDHHPSVSRAKGPRHGGAVGGGPAKPRWLRTPHEDLPSWPPLACPARLTVG